MTTVSAIIPTHNRQYYLRRAIDSVLAQTRPVDEVLVVDDGSTDGTEQAVRRSYGSRVRLFRQPHLGVSAARRHGIRQAGGEWIAFLDSDDEWTPERTERLLEACSMVASDVAWVFGDTVIIDDHGQQLTLYAEHGLELRSDIETFDDPFPLLHPFQFGLLPSSLIRRNVLLEVDAFSEGLRSSEDLLLGYQVAARFRFAAIPLVVTKVYRTADLRPTSLHLGPQGAGGPDYYRARILAYSLAIRSGRRNPWCTLYPQIVRGYCKALARQRAHVRKLALDQFRYGCSTKSLLFFALVLTLNGK